MSLQLILKHSSVSGKAPTAAQLAEGEISLNLHTDGPFLCCKDTAGDVVQLGGVTISTTAPTATKAAFWLDTSGTDPVLKVYDGSAWKSTNVTPTVTSIAGTAPITASTTGGVATIGIIDASQDAKGAVELATAAETTAGTDATRAVHPAGLKVELDKKAPLASPALTGTPTAPTAAVGTKTTQLATTEFVDTALGTTSGVWKRTGTELSPETAGDDVFTSGDVKVGGTTAAPNIELNADGSASFDGRVGIGTTPGGAEKLAIRDSSDVTLSISKTGVGAVKIGVDSGNFIDYTNQDLEFRYMGDEKARFERVSGNFLVGGTLPSAPNISLNADGSATFAGDIATTGVVFGTPSASATSNTLNDYEEGTWTPTITFATPGDLSVTYSFQKGSYTKIGDTVTVLFRIATSSFTHTTAAGALRIAGLPFAASDLNPNYQGSAFSGFQGITNASYTQYSAIVLNRSSFFSCAKNGSGQQTVNIEPSDTPTGGTVILHGTVTYKVN